MSPLRWGGSLRLSTLRSVLQQMQEKMFKKANEFFLNDTCIQCYININAVLEISRMIKNNVIFLSKLAQIIF